MGAWGGGPFDNDDAADWAGDLVESGSSDTVRETLSAVADTRADEYLEAPTASEALAAAEVVAAAAGRPRVSDASAEDALNWASEHRDVGAPDFLELARVAVARVEGPESELRELWLADEGADADAAAEWSSALKDLRSRLTG